MDARVSRIAGHIVDVKGLENPSIGSQVLVGEEGLVGEIVRVEGDVARVQVYEDTDGLSPGCRAVDTGKPMSAILGPGLLGCVFDGLERPLSSIGDFVERGGTRRGPDPEKKWRLEPKKTGSVKKGDIIGVVREGPIEHRILAPGDGFVEVRGGEYSLWDKIGYYKDEQGNKTDLSLGSEWPVHEKRPVLSRHPPREILLTGIRVIDCLFPMAKGGVGAIPGGFGAGKTVTLQNIAKYCDADIVVLALVGERGNECADVLESFKSIVDEKTGKSIMERSVVIANTSNMPVSARISSISLAATIAEYYRDMGYNVVLIADSTSRWAEALREISGLLEEIPGEEGYPTYLASRIAAFYARAGSVTTLGGREGSLTIIGAVSPPGGDFSDPVVQATKSVVRVFWALDTSLAYSRHYPAINWEDSYSLYDVSPPFSPDREEEEHDFRHLQGIVKRMLEEAGEIERVASLVGTEELSPEDLFKLRFFELFKEAFLQQNFFHEEDKYCPPRKQVEMLSILVHYYSRGLIAVRHGESPERVLDPGIVERLARMRYEKNPRFRELEREIDRMARVHENNENIGESGKQ